MGGEKASKTNVTARMGRKEKVEQPPQVIGLRGMRSGSTGVMTSPPSARRAETDEQRAAVAAFEAASKELKRANPKTSGFEKKYADAYARMRQLGLVD